MFVEEGEKILKSCLLPESIFDITQRPIDEGHFVEYQKHLEYVIPNLFDLISSRELELFDVLPETLKFRKFFVEFVCEQTGGCDLFRTQNDTLRKNLISWGGRIKKILEKDEKLRRELMMEYRRKLLGDAWKRNLGAIHGFLRFCHICFHDDDATKSLDLDNVMFILSIGIQFLENPDPSFKLCGLKLFSLILECTNEDILLETNTNQVIYTQAFDNINKILILSEECSQELWKCIWLAVSSDKKLSRDPEWNKLDDCINAIIYRLKMDSDFGTRCFLREIFLRFILFTSDRKEVNVSSKLLDDLKGKGNTDNVKCYRWAKSLLDLFVIQLLTITDTRQDVIRTIEFIHTTYLLTISTIRRELLDNLLNDFIKRVIPICAEILNMFHASDNIQEALVSFLETVHDQVQEKSCGNNYVTALGKFLTHLKEPKEQRLTS